MNIPKPPSKTLPADPQPAFKRSLNSPPMSLSFQYVAVPNSPSEPTILGDTSSGQTYTITVDGWASVSLQDRLVRFRQIQTSYRKRLPRHQGLRGTIRTLPLCRWPTFQNRYRTQWQNLLRRAIRPAIFFLRSCPLSSSKTSSGASSPSCSRRRSLSLSPTSRSNTLTFPKAV